MEANRDQYLQEYFELVRRLNSANKLKNQKTDIYFLIKTENHETRLYAALHESQKIYLCYRNKVSLWQSGEVSGFFELESFLSEILSSHEIQNVDLTSLIKSQLFKLS